MKTQGAGSGYWQIFNGIKVNMLTGLGIFLLCEFSFHFPADDYRLKSSTGQLGCRASIGDILARKWPQEIIHWLMTLSSMHFFSLSWQLCPSGHRHPDPLPFILPNQASVFHLFFLTLPLIYSVLKSKETIQTLLFHVNYCIRNLVLSWFCGPGLAMSLLIISSCNVSIDLAVLGPENSLIKIWWQSLWR